MLFCVICFIFAPIMVKKTTLREALSERILLLDGGMGSMVQQYHLGESDYHTDCPCCGGKGELKGNNDLLVLSRPDVVAEIHRRYLEAGADIITTDTFSAQRISQQEYGTTHHVMEMNRAAARLARQEADRYTALTPDRPRFVLGDVGPTSKMLSMSDDVNDPAARAITFDELEAAYREQIEVLVEEGVDGILIETIFDTLNAKAAISAYLEINEIRNQGNQEMPEILLSMTVSDASGRLLSGQTVEAFVTSVLHANPLALGLNCGLGASGMVPWLRQMSAAAPCAVSCHPNAGLPNQEGGYDDTPDDMIAQMEPFFSEHLVNIIGGCCGTTPAHIAAMRKRIDEGSDTQPRVAPERAAGLHLAGMDAFTFSRTTFVKVGERCNVAGSRKFLKLINEKKYDEALEIARKQVDDGAMVVDVNMDDGLLDAKSEMRTFLNLLASDPAIARVPVMVDSSRFDVIVEGLKCLQGKGIVNSISLKLGEEEFVAHARVVKRLGAAVIDMCFDEVGQATDYDRRVAICQRGYQLLTQQAGFAPDDIIFDPNVLTVATGMAEHAAYASDFIRATRWVTDNLPGTRISGGLSNLSFAFRGNNYLREAMHSVFLHHAIANGMNMAIMNPATALLYKSIPAELRLAIGEVVLNTSPEASEELIELAGRMAAAKEEGKDPLSIFGHDNNSGHELSNLRINNGSVAEFSNSLIRGQESRAPEQVIRECLLKGLTNGLEESLNALLTAGKRPVEIISGPLMEGMNEVGRLFGEGKMFLPQVVKTARTMKRAVEVLEPYFQQADDAVSTKIAKVVIATVKGDVHDIGKNIVGVVLACNNFDVIDLGVMVAPETIVQAAIDEKADFVCLSGLITPSLDEMCQVARQMEAAGLTIPIIVGGATTSDKHTQLKIQPLYSGKVIHVRDAAQNPVVCMKLLNHDSLTDEIPAEETGSVAIAQLRQLIDWTYFFWAWRTKADIEVGKELRADAEKLLDALQAEGDAFAPRYAFRFAAAEGNTETGAIAVAGETLSAPVRLAAMLHENRIGMFATTMAPAFVKRLEELKAAQGGGDYDVLLLQTVADRLAEALSEHLHQRLKQQYGLQGIRPAVGYPSFPEQKNVFVLQRLLHFDQLGISVTENGAMYPQASTCGIYIGNEEATYFE